MERHDDEMGRAAAPRATILPMPGQGWESQEFADTWKKKAAERRILMAVVTDAMFEAAGVMAGARVLDLGTGTGDTAIEAGERVGATGSVLATDASPSMVQAAQEAVAAAGATNVTVRQLDSAALAGPEVAAGAFDAAIARCVLMFVDRPKTFAGVLRALRPGGCFAAVVWGPVSENPYHGRAIEAGRARGSWGEKMPQVARAFSINEEGVWVRWLAEAGFVEVSQRVMVGERRYASGEEAFTAMRESPIHAEPLAHLGEAQREEAWAELQRYCVEMKGVFPTQYLVLRGAKAG
jgi:ubiquinone/menaquinone biosynthesis C-methylase UbiE